MTSLYFTAADSPMSQLEKETEETLEVLKKSLQKHNELVKARISELEGQIKQEEDRLINLFA